MRLKRQVGAMNTSVQENLSQDGHAHTGFPGPDEPVEVRSVRIAAVKHAYRIKNSLSCDQGARVENDSISQREVLCHARRQFNSRLKEVPRFGDHIVDRRMFHQITYLQLKLVGRPQVERGMAVDQRAGLGKGENGVPQPVWTCTAETASGRAVRIG